MNYFDSRLSLDDAKRKYRSLAKEHHPDRGGDIAVMQQINSEYESYLKNKSITDTVTFNQWAKVNEDWMREYKIYTKLFILIAIEVLQIWLRRTR